MAFAHRRHDPDGVPQYERGRAVVFRGPDDEGGQYRRPGQPARTDRSVWANQPRRGFSAHRPRAAGRAGTGKMSRELRCSAGRVWAMLLRYLYLLRSSWPRTLELLYWPTLQMLIWGFMSQFLYSNQLCLPRLRRPARRGHVVGCAVPGSARLVDVVSRGDVGTQPSSLSD